MTTWFTADTHFSHANIIKYCQRPFSSADEMNSELIKNWNASVQPFEHVWHLGDFGFFKKKEVFETIFNSLNGVKHLIIGNHDPEFVVEGPWASVHDYYELKLNKQMLILFHYPIASWNHVFHGACHFYGHVHGVLKIGKGALDVGVDSVGFAPISLEAAVELCQ